MNWRSQRREWIEGGGLLLATPFLLFPTIFWPGTFIALLFVAFSWIGLSRNTQRAWIPLTPLNVALLLWLISIAVGILVSADPDLTLPKATGLLLGLTVWRYLTLMGKNERLIWGMVAAYLALGLGFTIVGVASTNWIIKIPGLIRWLPPKLLSLPESKAVGVQMNQLAGTILLYFPLLLSLFIQAWVQRHQQKRVWWWLVLILPVALILLLTQSRGGWIAGVAAIGLLLLLWGWLLPPSRPRFLLRLLLLLGLLASLAGFVIIGPERLQSLWQNPAQETIVGNLSTVSYRQEIWKWGLVALADFPFTGTGLGTFRQVLPRLYPSLIPTSHDVAHAHNMLLQVGLDLGIPGLVAYLALLGLGLGLGWQVARKNVAWRGVALGLIGSLVALHIFGLADALAPGSKPGLLFWWALGLLTAMHNHLTVKC